MEGHGFLLKGESKEIFIVPVKNEETVPNALSGLAYAYCLSQFFYKRYKFYKLTD